MNNYTEHTTETLTQEYKKMIAEVVRREQLIELGLTEEEALWFEVPAVIGVSCLVSLYIDGKFYTCKEFPGSDRVYISINMTLAEAKEFADICKDFWNTFAPARKTLRAKINAFCKMRIDRYGSTGKYESEIIGFIED